MSAIELLEIEADEEYLLVEKVEEAESKGGIILVNSILHLARIIHDGTGRGREGKIALLRQAPEFDLDNGQFITHQTNVAGTAKIKE